jgi:hypothetical protein
MQSEIQRKLAEMGDSINQGKVVVKMPGPIEDMARELSHAAYEAGISKKLVEISEEASEDVDADADAAPIGKESDTDISSITSSSSDSDSDDDSHDESDSVSSKEGKLKYPKNRISTSDEEEYNDPPSPTLPFADQNNPSSPVTQTFEPLRSSDSNSTKGPGAAFFANIAKALGEAQKAKREAEVATARARYTMQSLVPTSLQNIQRSSSSSTSSSSASLSAAPALSTVGTVPTAVSSSEGENMKTTLSADGSTSLEQSESKSGSSGLLGAMLSWWASSGASQPATPGSKTASSVSNPPPNIRRTNTVDSAGRSNLPGGTIQDRSRSLRPSATVGSDVSGQHQRSQQLMQDQQRPINQQQQELQQQRGLSTSSVTSPSEPVRTTSTTSVASNQSLQPSQQTLPRRASTNLSFNSSITSSSPLDRRIPNESARAFWAHYWSTDLFEVSLSDFLSCLEEYYGSPLPRETILGIVRPVEGLRGERLVGTKGLNLLVGDFESLKEALDSISTSAATEIESQMRNQLQNPHHHHHHHHRGSRGASFSRGGGGGRGNSRSGSSSTVMYPSPSYMDPNTSISPSPSSPAPPTGPSAPAPPIAFMDPPHLSSSSVFLPPGFPPYKIEGSVSQGTSQ